MTGRHRPPRVKVNRAGIVHHQVVQRGELSSAKPPGGDVEERAHRDIQNAGATAADRGGRGVVAGPAKCRAHRVGIARRYQPQTVDVQGPGLQIQGIDLKVALQVHGGPINAQVPSKDAAIGDVKGATRQIRCPD